VREGFEQGGRGGKVPPCGEHTRGLGPLSRSANGPVSATSNSLPLRQPSPASPKVMLATAGRPWGMISDDQKAMAFERYLKSGSGRAFSAKRFW